MSSADTYKIVVNGAVAPGQDLKHVQDAFCELFRIDSEQVSEFFLGQPQIIREGLSATSAGIYLKALENIGLKSKLLRQDQPQTAGEATCPKCKMTQVVAEECVKCGVVMSKAQHLKEEVQVRTDAQEAAENGVPAVSAASGLAHLQVLVFAAVVVVASGTLWQLFA